jgi:hypothetical protein
MTRRRLIAVAGVLLAIALTTDTEADLLHKEVAQKGVRLSKGGRPGDDITTR